MKININLPFDYLTSFLRRSVLPSLSALQKKTMLIAAIAFGCLAACCVISRCFIFHKKAQHDVVNVKEVDGKVGEDLIGKGIVEPNDKITRGSFRSKIYSGGYLPYSKDTS